MVRNIVSTSSFDIFDMLVMLVGLYSVFFGLRALHTYLGCSLFVIWVLSFWTVAFKPSKIWRTLDRDLGD
jgi:hypothetical protein